MKHEILVETWDHDGRIMVLCGCGWEKQFGHSPKLDELTEAAAAHLLEHERTVTA